MGNIFSKKNAWKEELHTIKTELAALHKRKSKWCFYEKRAKFISNCCLLAGFVTAVVLFSFSYFYASLALLICSLLLCLIIKFCISDIFNRLAKHDEAMIAKYCSTKDTLVKEIKNKVTYNEAKSLLAGYDSEIDFTNGAALNLEPVVY